MPNELSKSMIGIRSQEFQEGLKGVDFELKEMHMETTLLIGKTASLATHLKGLDYIENYQGLKALASQLGITSTELRPVLKELQEVDFASVVEQGSKIKRIELRIPELRDGYKDLGERWTQLNPGEIEQAAIHVLDNVASFPHSEASVRNNLGLNGKDFDTVLAISKAGLLVAQHEYANGESVLYSPLTVEEKPDALLTLMQKFPEDQIVTAFQKVQATQGIPLDLVVDSTRDVITQAVLLGVLCPVQIKSHGPERTFLFAPRGGLKKEEKIILEKARAILACVRTGQHFAKGKGIEQPRALLKALRERKSFRRPRPDFPEQYSLLITKGIGRIEEDKYRSGHYYFFLIDTPENILALNTAIDLLETGQIPSSRLEVDAGEFLGVSGSLLGTLTARQKIGRGVALSKEMTRDIFLEISTITRGVVK